MKVLVVGGAGYIGSVTVEALVTKGHEVTVLDNLSCGHRNAVPADASFILGDTQSDSDLDQALLGHPDAVMHFAALSLVGVSVQNPALYFQNNVVGGIKLLDAMLRHSVGTLIFSSTCSVYGEPTDSPIDETLPLSPTNPYGDTKLAFEKILKWYANAYSMKYVSLRYFNAAGATTACGENHDPETHLIPVVLQVARGLRDSVTINGDDYQTPDGTCVRDYIHVSDLAQAHLLAMNFLMENDRSAIYNVGSERGFSVKEVIDVVRKVTGHPIPTVTGPRRPGDAAVLVASSKKIKEELGWKPEKTDLDTIIGDAWKWQQSHLQTGKPDAVNRV